jgi:hypothetical protein
VDAEGVIRAKGIANHKDRLAEFVRQIEDERVADPVAGAPVLTVHERPANGSSVNAKIGGEQ